VNNVSIVTHESVSEMSIRHEKELRMAEGPTESILFMESGDWLIV
jgi:hypothetical protein